MTSRKNLFIWLMWFYFSNLFLFWLIGARYLPHLSYTVSLTGSLPTQFIIVIWTFTVTAFISQLALLSMLPSAIIMVPFIFIIPHRVIIKILAIIISLILAIVLVVDTYVYALYHYHLNGFIWTLLTGGAFTDLVNLSTKEWLIFAGFVVVLLFIELLFAFILVPFLMQKKGKKILISAGIIIFLSWLIAFLLFIGAALNRFRFLNDAARTIPWYTQTIAQFVPAKNVLGNLERANENFFLQARHSTPKLHYPLSPMEYNTPKKPLNIFFILIDAWRFDTLTNDITPHVFQFSKKAWVFDHHFSGGNSTGPGIFTLFYSLPYTYWDAALAEHREPILIKRLLDLHYQTGVFGSAPLYMPAFNKTVFLHIPNLIIQTKGDTPYQRDEEINREFKNFIDKAVKIKRPIFGFLFYDSAHAIEFPPNFPTKFNPWWKKINRTELNKNSNPLLFYNRYKNALNFVDTLVDKDLQLLKEKGLLKNSIIILTGDHGQEFNDNHRNYWGHASNFTHWQVETPLIIYWPDHQPETFRYLTTHYDIAPFLLNHILGAKTLINQYSVGRPLLQAGNRPFFIASSYNNLGIITRNYYIMIFPTGSYEIYNNGAKPLVEKKLNVTLLRHAFQLMRQFYQ